MENDDGTFKYYYFFFYKKKKKTYINEYMYLFVKEWII